MIGAEAAAKTTAAEPAVTTGTGSPVVLTAHPLQRVGAFALAALAGAGDPEKMTGAQFARAAATMTEDVVATADVEDAKAPGGFWLGVSHLMWPNSELSHPGRKNRTSAERKDRIRAWRCWYGPNAAVS